MQRNVFFISDGTGITAESFGQSLLTQFDDLTYKPMTLPYVNDRVKAAEALAYIQSVMAEDGNTTLPILFMTVVNDDVRTVLNQCHAYTVDLCATFMPGLEKEIGQHALNKMGRKRANCSSESYHRRIEAVQFALDNDDGAGTRHYNKADIILLGASRSGKTPTCIYLGLQFGIFAANYPITEEDLEVGNDLPKSLLPYRSKLFGMTIDANRLADIRQERKPDSRYASVRQCYHEIRCIERIYQQESIGYINTSNYSVEEIATRIMAQTHLERRLK
ncbi:Phosphoenolpyruvate synthase regulatory protein [invertebrate metagenome]|uniref:Phosphoenolpyruvate synthase regulatory protein n=1 Tax=invertebrate metagenome TaxID=1711999 RepID=A0A2H9T7J0_9ZZZZ